MAVQFLSWSDEFLVGHEGLDAEHRQLVDAINEIYSVVCAGQTADKLISLLDDLNGLTERHLRHESSVISEINSGPLPRVVNRLAFLRSMVDAAIEEHLVNHMRSLSLLRDIIRDVRSALGSADQKLCLSLKAWFIDHAMNYDAQLKEVFRSLGRTPK